VRISPYFEEPEIVIEPDNKEGGTNPVAGNIAVTSPELALFVTVVAQKKKKKSLEIPLNVYPF